MKILFIALILGSSLSQLLPMIMRTDFNRIDPYNTADITTLFDNRFYVLRANGNRLNLVSNLVWDVQYDTNDSMFNVDIESTEFGIDRSRFAQLYFKYVDRSGNYQNSFNMLRNRGARVSELIIDDIFEGPDDVVEMILIEFQRDDLVTRMNAYILSTETTLQNSSIIETSFNSQNLGITFNQLDIIDHN